MVDPTARGQRGRGRGVSGVAAIILAAGQGTRFGQEPKLLAVIESKPLLRHVADAAVASAARPIIAVLGHRCADVVAALDGLNVIAVDNSAYRNGLSTSLKAGFAALPDEAEAAIILLGDMPRVSADVINQLIEAWRAAERPSAVVPLFGGQRGNPVLLSRVLASEIASLTGDMGAGPLLRGRSSILEVAMNDPAVLQDVDTSDALNALR